MNADHYTYRVRWSAEDDAYVGTVAELPSLSWVAEEQTEAFQGIRDLVVDVLADMESTGEVPPGAIADRTYSGNFLVRLTPEAHRQLALDAAEQHVSLNRLAANRLTGAGAR
jgi:predicted HicB family RNase H-like nuclease